MNRKEFFMYVVGEFFTAEEERNIPNRNFVDFDVEKTSFAMAIKDNEVKKDIKSFLEEEREKDNWLFLSEEFAGMAIQMMSNGKVDGDVGTKEIEYMESMYYNLVDGIYKIASLEEFRPDLIKKAYVDHMDKLRDFLLKVMDMDEVNKI